MELKFFVVVVVVDDVVVVVDVLYENPIGQNLATTQYVTN